MTRTALLLVGFFSWMSLLSCGRQASSQSTQRENTMQFYYASLINNQTIEVKSQVALDKPPTLELINHTTNQRATLTHKAHPAKLLHHFTLEQPISELSHHLTVAINNGTTTHEMPLRLFKFYDHPDFTNHYLPPNTIQWGVMPTTESTTFNIWSPTASDITLNLYEDGVNSPLYESYPLTRGARGHWQLTLQENLIGRYYNYSVTNAGQTHTLTDPYAITTGTNGRRALITTPEIAFRGRRFDSNEFIKVAPKDAILYELHVRDLSMSATTNHSEDLRGKFLGVVQTGTTNQYGQSTGLDHIKDLGVTHIHFLPIYDYNSVDEGNLQDNVFNWGYDPLNYSVPEGSYSSNPADGYVRMRELKAMVDNLHEHGIGVVMDVVYNHTGPVTDHYFQHLVPDYYFRMDEFGNFSNGSGTGNETASEREMFRRYMVDSLKHWATTYQIDGFRFDLMAVHDIETMNLIAQELKAINPYVVLYGEGWTGGGSPLPAHLSATKTNTYQMPDIAVFNDDIRDGLKGWVFDAKESGFVNGNPEVHARALFGYLGALQNIDGHGDGAYAKLPTDTIAYVSAHDNHTLYDRWLESVPGESFEEYMRLQIMANAMVLTSPGIPFLHAGVEMMRTKNGDENSYKSPDSTNQLDYDLKNRTQPLFNYYKNLIQIRKNHPLFKQGLLPNGNHAFEIVKGSQEDPLFMAFRVIDHTNSDAWQGVYLIFNAGENTHTVNLSGGEWRLFADTWQVTPDLTESTFRGSITVEPKSIAMLYQPK
ncbi:type I pullulanase [Entomospira culicis]|uniref:Type I pullulanase n=1 Tax=Entomospira culicis TaxID=2719989 RepID=A0A968GFE8_9SPIO|nr:type I pullulanase [Entomospira culicis]NIZ19499.1 type I pullulanase [Entomospira culicis]NIZ69596.1 type I pullulanase [Entomospira culicis]WDI36707.1 type I pullulanase [Entomospira culicis]WDI38336.1 type I pullulanase [Entomospira culicis]